MVKTIYIIIKLLIKPNICLKCLIKELTLTIDGVNTERVNQFNVLDFTLILYLIWSKHIDRIANKRSSRTIGIIVHRSTDTDVIE